MKKLALAFFIAIMAAGAQAQSPVHQQVAETFVLRFNQSDFEMIFQSFSLKMQQSKPKAYFLRVLSKTQKEYGQLNNLQPIEFKQDKRGSVRGIYQGNFQYGNLTVRLTTDASGQIIGLYLIKEKNLI